MYVKKTPPTTSSSVVAGRLGDRMLHGGRTMVGNGSPFESIVRHAEPERNRFSRRPAYIELGGELCAIVPMGIASENYKKRFEKVFGHPLVMVAPNLREVETCREWLRTFARPRKSVNRDCTSYGLKHRVEAWAGTYVSNGAFIQAAILEGYGLERQHDPNVCLMASFLKGRRQ